MSISFRCSKCGQLLVADDGGEGRQMRCPACGSSNAVPAGSASADMPSVQHASPQRKRKLMRTAAEAGLFVPGHAAFARLGYATLFKLFFRTIARRFGDFVQICLVVGCVSALAELILTGLIPEFLPQDPKTVGAYVGIIRAANFIHGLLAACIFIGTIVSFLRFARGERIDYRAFAVGFGYLCNMFFLNLGLLVIFALIMNVAQMALVFGEIAYVVTLFLAVLVGLSLVCSAPFFLVDRDAGPFVSIQLSYKYSKSNLGKIFVFFIALCLIGVPAALAVELAVEPLPPYVGYMLYAFLLPVAMYPFVIVYLAVTGQVVLRELIARKIES